MDITGVFIVFYVTSISGTCVLGLYRHTYSACYGITTDNFIKASCPGDDEKIVMDSVYAYAKPLSTNCPEVMTSAATTPESCCQYASDDCGSEYEGFNKNTYFENCHGRTTCSWTPVTWTNAPCNSSVYSMRTSYMVVYFYCISENDVRDISEDGSVNTTTALLLNPGYESGNGTGTLPANSSYKCSISASCATSLKIRALNLNFTEEGGICGQSLTLTDETNTRVLRCDSNTDYLPYDLEIGNNTHYLEIQVDNTLNTDSGYFILQIGSNHDDDVVTLACGTSVGEGKVAEEDLPECSDATKENNTETTTASMDNITSITTPYMGNDTNITTPYMGNDTNTTTPYPANNTDITTPYMDNDTDITTQYVGNDTDITTPYMDNDTDITTQYVGNDTNITTSYPANDTDTTTPYPTNDTDTTTPYPANDTNITTSYPANDTDITTSYPANDTDITTPYPANDTDITTPYPANDTDITTSYPANDTDITTSYPANDTDITTSYPANDTDTTTPYLGNDTDTTTPYMDNNTDKTTVFPGNTTVLVQTTTPVPIEDEGMPSWVYAIVVPVAVVVLLLIIAAFCLCRR